MAWQSIAQGWFNDIARAGDTRTDESKFV